MSRIRSAMLAAAALLTMAAPAGVAAEEAAAKPVEVDFSWDKGFALTTSDDRFKLRLNGALNFRYVYVDFDHHVVGNESNYSNFYMRRARLYLRGHAFDPRFTYFFHIQLEPSRSVNSHDLWLEYDFADLAKLGVGRNKVAYGLEFLNSGLALNLVERSVMYGISDVDQGGGGAVYPGGGTAPFGMNSEADTGFATGGLTLYRSQGVQLRGMRGSATTSTWEYQAGVWQGRNSTGLSNSGTGHLFSLRVGYSPWGWVNWALEGDGEGVQTFKAGFFLSGYHNSHDEGEDFDEHGANLAVQTRYRGFSADLEWGFESFDLDDQQEAFERRGWRMLVGYFVMPAKLELVTRYSEIQRLVDATMQRSMDSGLGVAELYSGEGTVVGIEKKISEIAFGVNYFINSWHRHKVQVMVNRLIRDFAADPEAGVHKADPQVDLAFSIQVQLVF